MHARTMGGTVGIAVGQAIYTSILKKKINKIPGLSGFDTSSAALSESVRTLKLLPVCAYLICSPSSSQAECTTSVAT